MNATWLILGALLGLAFAQDSYDDDHDEHSGSYGYRRGPHRYGYRPRYGGYNYYYRKCLDLNRPANGQVEQSGSKPGSKAVYSCNEGYNLVGEDTRKCQKNGKWSGTAPVCEIVDCGPPSDADENGIVNVKKTTYLSRAVYFCNKGYLLDESMGGSQFIVCQADGTWSDVAPGCNAIDCGDLPAPDFGSVTFHPDTTLDSEARFACDRGYKLVGDSVRVCECTGLWSLHQPTCEKITCPKLKAPKFGKVFVYGFCVDDYAEYKCQYGFELSDKSRRVCQEDGTWSGSDPTCEKKHYDYHHGKYPHHGGY